MERPIGEQFDYDEIKLKVIKRKKDSCKGCYFKNIISCRFKKIVNITGFCGKTYRKDKTNIIFKKVKE